MLFYTIRNEVVEFLKKYQSSGPERLVLFQKTEEVLTSARMYLRNRLLPTGHMASANAIWRTYTYDMPLHDARIT